MKINHNLTAISLFICLSFYSCKKKYSDGPFFSFYSREARVANTWKMQLVTLNDVDITKNYTDINYTETYDKDASYSYNSTTITGKGKWEFESDYTLIKRSAVSGQSTQDLIILRLKQKSFWYKYADGKNNYEFHLIPDE
ncbi:MAG TPA: DUF5004 domain-containing protein [Bacteroidia bacterium]|nr:DUF5004 domain-containing protein [Bacteroidia bacterium]